MSRHLPLVALMVAVLLAALGWRAWHLPSGKPATATVEAGEPAAHVAERLEDEGVVRSASAFKRYLAWADLDVRLRPGTYDINDATTLSALGAILAKGDSAQDERQLTLLEGWNLNDIAGYLVEEQAAAKEDFHALAGHTATRLSGSGLERQKSLREKYEWFAGVPKTATLEGFLFPDTYRVFRDASVEEIVGVFLANFDRKYSPELREAVASSGHSFFEIVTMASILEREVRGAEDKKIVADLFWRRIALGMPLQADSTVNYATGGNRPSVTFADLEIDSPYNTYMYRGLTPGPISNPGVESLMAAAQPTPNEYLFFLTDNQGTVHYAKDFEGHKANRVKYLGK
jgi:UPF0755 protein